MRGAGEIETTYLGFANGWGADGIETKERLLSMVRTYLMASDISLGGSCWRENLGSQPINVLSYALSSFDSLRSVSFSASSFIIHGPHAPPAPEFLSFRIVNAKGA